ncbi:MAG TPA: CBS domain-containing protein [Bryobacteraceae bacterium]|nr:CBS domain-containing protein [Bryobacteraceae bacterium]
MAGTTGRTKKTREGKTMQVHEVMTTNISSCSPETNAAAAAEVMWTNNTSYLPIVENGGNVVGIVTDRDLFIALGTQNRRASDMTVGEIMQRHVACCSPDDDLRRTLTAMANENAQRLLVVDGSGHLLGALTVNDLLNRTNDTFNDDVIRTLRAISQDQSQTRRATA